MGAIAVRERPKATPTCVVSSVSLLRRYEPREKESIETKIRKLEIQFDRYIQTMLRSLLTSKEIEDMTTLSEASLKNIATLQRLAKQIQGASNVG